MTKTFIAAIAAAVLSFGASAALAQMAEPAKIACTSKGKELVDARGMTPYTLDRDNVVGILTC
jgi:predicted lipoprotein with Yx(FWY)xxD motif